jgi:uncharacterized protein YdaU (DUF1376 family)
LNYYERHIGDYLKDTAHLSLLEHGIYSRLLDVYYTRETGIEEGVAARLVGARSKEELSALNVVLGEFFKLVDGVWKQSRCDREIERYTKRADHNRRVGQLGGRPKKTETQTEPTKNPVGFQTEPTENPNRTLPVTSNQKPIEKTCSKPRGLNVAEFPPGFDAFWSVYPRRQGKGEAAKAFTRLRPDESLLQTIVAAVTAQASSEQWRKDGGKFIPMPATWLNGQRWLDETTSSAADPELAKLFARGV